MDNKNKTEKPKSDPSKFEAPLLNLDEKVIRSKEEMQNIVDRLCSKARQNNTSQKNLSAYKINHTFTNHMVSHVNLKIDIENGNY